MRKEKMMADKSGNIFTQFFGKAAKAVKMTFESKATAKSKKRQSKLDDIRKDLATLMARANEAISRLKESGLYEQSAAVQEAMSTHSRAKGINQEELFSLDDKKRLRDLQREANRLYSFLSSAEVQENVVAYNIGNKLSFQDQHEAFMKTGNRFEGEDQDRIKAALKIYRHIASTDPAAIGKEGYGSDKLLNLIYDELEGYDPYDIDGDYNADLEAKAHDAAYWALEQFKQNVEWGFVNGTPLESVDYGIVSQLNEATSVEDYLKSKDLNRRNF